MQNTKRQVPTHWVNTAVVLVQLIFKQYLADFRNLWG
jgi:hypothetical protein